MGVTEASERWAILGPGLGSLLDDAVGAFVLLDADGVIVDWNRAAQATFGWTRAQAVGAEAVELLVARDLQDQLHAAFGRLVASDRRGPSPPVELRAVHRDGREMPMELVLSTVDTGGRWLVAAFLYDVSERNRTMAGLALANSRFAGAFAAASIGMALVSPAGRVLQVNEALRGLLGPLDPVLLPDETAAGEPPPWLDCDTTDDLRRARDWAARAGSEQEATR